MFPTFRNRLIITIAAVVGGVVWGWAAQPLQAADGSEGISLFAAATGPALGAMYVIGFGLAALLLATLAAAAGNPLSGVFVAAVALCGLAGEGGSIDGWIRRAGANLPGGYLLLAVETALWFIVMLALLVAGLRARDWLRAKLPWLANQPSFGDEMKPKRPDPAALVAAIAAAVIGGVLARFLLRSTDIGQVIGGLFLAFTLAGLGGTIIAAHAFDQTRINPIGVLISPALVAIVSYVLTGIGHADGQAFMQRYIAGGVAGTSLALPVHYASAAVAGCAFGAGWAQALLHGHDEKQQRETEAAQA